MMNVPRPVLVSIPIFCGLGIVSVSALLSCGLGLGLGLGLVVMWSRYRVF